MEIITDADLAAYLQQTLNAATATLLVDKANDLVSEYFDEDLAPPYPTRLWSITIEVAARAYRNPKGTTSISRAFDDSSRTERWETDGSGKTGIYLTEAELDEVLGIAGKKTYGETVRLGIRHGIYSH